MASLLENLFLLINLFQLLETEHLLQYDSLTFSELAKKAIYVADLLRHITLLVSLDIKKIIKLKLKLMVNFSQPIS